MNSKLNMLKVKTTQEVAPAVSNILLEQGAEGIQIDDQHGPKNVSVITYFKNDVDMQSKRNIILQRVKNLTNFGLDPGEFEIDIKKLNEDKITNVWEQYYHAERITRFLTIVPAWEDYQEQENDQIIIKLDPGKSFGTGTHPTTKMSLQALETIIRGGEKVFDVGTGSGVLSIAAKKLGAGDIWAWDNDKIAVEATKRNIKLNKNIQGINVGVNSLLDGIKGKTDIIVANMLASVLMPLIQQAAQHLDEGGKFILAGIYYDKLDGIKNELNSNGFVIKQVNQMDKWRSIIAVKGEE